jgi:Fic family protein
MLTLVAEIAASLGRLDAIASPGKVPMLRRENRIKSIHSSLAIENNTLTLDQVTAVIEGKRVLGPAREVQEVKNAFEAYEAMSSWNPSASKDLLSAHRILMRGLMDDAGRFRSRAVGIAQGRRIVHLAPPADRVPGLMKDLLGWLKRSDAHPLVAGCVFHYELEFIHPFADGNGRIGRLWQTLILSRWNPLFAFLPVETVIRERQADYYKVLAACDKAGSSTAFIEFLLAAILTALGELATPEVAPEVTPEVGRMLRVLRNEMTRREIMGILGLRDEKHFREHYQQAALAAGLLEMTSPDKPNSRLQKYRLTEKGRSFLS